jgi:hypothetical protein
VREKRLEAHCPEKPKQEVDIRQGALNFKRFQTFSRRSAFPRHTHRLMPDLVQTQIWIWHQQFRLRLANQEDVRASGLVM